MGPVPRSNGRVGAAGGGAASNGCGCEESEIGIRYSRAARRSALPLGTAPADSVRPRSLRTTALSPPHRAAAGLGSCDSEVRTSREHRKLPRLARRHRAHSRPRRFSSVASSCANRSQVLWPRCYGRPRRSAGKPAPSHVCARRRMTACAPGRPPVSRREVFIAVITSERLLSLRARLLERALALQARPA